MDDASGFLFVALAVIALVVLGFFFFRTVLVPPRPTASQMTRIRSTTSGGSGVDDLFKMLFVAALGYAAYRFIQSGGLKKVLNILSETPLNVNGEITTIEKAAETNTDIAQLLREALEKRIATLDTNQTDSAPSAVASDVAQMLRDAISARFRERGI
jgi:hypothetical protein